MRVELGNTAPIQIVNGEVQQLEGPTVTVMTIPDEYTYEVADSANQLSGDLARHLAVNQLVTHVPEQEAFLSVAQAWANHSTAPPSYVTCDNQDFGKLLAEFYGCPQRDVPEVAEVPEEEN